MHGTIDEMLEVVLSMRSAPRLYKKVNFARVEAGSNTSTVTLRVVGGEEKENLLSETVKYGHEFQGIRTRERLRWRGPVAYIKDRPVLSSERGPHNSRP
jgi:hypothetical protein